MLYSKLGADPIATHHASDSKFRAGRWRDGGGDETLRAAWTCHVYNSRTRVQHVFFGRHEYHLIRQGDGLCIKREKITLMNDYVPGMIDVFCV